MMGRFSCNRNVDKNINLGKRTPMDRRSDHVNRSEDVRTGRTKEPAFGSARGGHDRDEELKPIASSSGSPP
jgi:hypothetical protein